MDRKPQLTTISFKIRFKLEYLILVFQAIFSFKTDRPNFLEISELVVWFILVVNDSNGLFFEYIEDDINVVILFSCLLDHPVPLLRVCKDK